MRTETSGASDAAESYAATSGGRGPGGAPPPYGPLRNRGQRDVADLLGDDRRLGQAEGAARAALQEELRRPGDRAGRLHEQRRRCRLALLEDVLERLRGVAREVEAAAALGAVALRQQRVLCAWQRRHDGRRR